MKSAHRHQLETNVLADWVGHKLTELEPYKNVIAIGFVVILGLILVSVFSFSGEDPVVAQQWGTYFSAFALRDPAPMLENVANNKEGANSSAALWAKKSLADQKLASGCEMIFVNRKEALENLAKAEEWYEQVVQHSSHPLLKNTALIGLARAQESMDKKDDALKSYKEVIANGKDSALTKSAEEGVARLENPRVTEALAWVLEQTPALPAGHPPLNGMPGLNAPLPDRPDLSFPASPLKPDGTAKPESSTPPAEEPKAEEPKPETPATEEAKPAETTTEPAPAESAPAAETKPAEPTPPATEGTEPAPAGDK